MWHLRVTFGSCEQLHPGSTTPACCRPQQEALYRKADPARRYCWARAHSDETEATYTSFGSWLLSFLSRLPANSSCRYENAAPLLVAPETRTCFTLLHHNTVEISRTQNMRMRCPIQRRLRRCLLLTSCSLAFQQRFRC